MNTRRDNNVAQANQSRRRRYLIAISLFLLLGLSLFTGKRAYDAITNPGSAGTSVALTDDSVNPAATADADLGSGSEQASVADPSAARSPRSAYRDALLTLKKLKQMRYRTSENGPMLADAGFARNGENSNAARLPRAGRSIYRYGDKVNGWNILEGVSIWTPGRYPELPVRYGADTQAEIDAAKRAAAAAAGGDLCPVPAPAPKAAGMKLTASIIYVDLNSEAGTDADGLSWATAYPNLHSALQYAAGQVWVAAGDYTATDVPADLKDDDMEAADYSFVMLGGVRIYGGFKGDETSLSQRSPSTNVTRLVGGGAYHVVVGVSNGTLDGFTITGGNANGSDPAADGFGGGIYNLFANPTIINCAIVSNQAKDGGGGVCNDYSSPKFINCTFTGNTSKYGGAMTNLNSNPRIVNCSFSTNSANFGGAIDNYQASPVLINCILWGNTATPDPGNDVTLTENNTGISFSVAGTITGPAGAFTGAYPGCQVTVAGSSGNSGTFTVLTYATGASDVLTVEETVADEAAGASVTVTLLASAGAEIFIDPVPTSNVQVSYSDIDQDLTTTGFTDNGNNIRQDPRFVSGTDLHLQFPDAPYTGTLVSATDGGGGGPFEAVLPVATASTVDNYYVGMQIQITSGPGAGQFPLTITAYVAASQTITVGAIWNPLPDNTSQFSIGPIPTPAINAGTATATDVPAFGKDLNPRVDPVVVDMGAYEQGYDIEVAKVRYTYVAKVMGATTNTVQLDPASSTTDDFYNGRIITIIFGRGVGETFLITDYDGASQIATIAGNWLQIPQTGPDADPDTSWFDLDSGTFPVTEASEVVTNGHVANPESLTDPAVFRNTLTVQEKTIRYRITNRGFKDLRLTGYPKADLEAEVILTFTVTEDAVTPLDPFGVPTTPPAGAGADVVIVPGGSAEFEITFSARAEGIYNGTVSILNSCGSKSPYTFTIAGVSDGYNGVIPPEVTATNFMEVWGNEVEILNNDKTPSLEDHTNFGDVRVGRGEVVRTFTIRNNLEGIPLDLLLTNDLHLPNALREYVQLFEMDGVTPSTDFTIIAQPTFPGAGFTFLPKIEPDGGSVTFQIQFIGPDTTGLRRALVRIENNDYASDPFTFAISANVSATTGGGGGGGGGSGASASGCSMGGSGHPGSFYLPFLAVLALLGLGRLRFAKAE